MVISNKQRKLQNRRKAAKKAKRRATAAPAPKTTKPAPANKLLPVGVKPDDLVSIFDMDLPSRAIMALEEDGLMTKGDVRKYIRENGSIEEIRGIGGAWASLIEKLVK